MKFILMDVFLKCSLCKKKCWSLPFIRDWLILIMLLKWCCSIYCKTVIVYWKFLIVESVLSQWYCRYCLFSSLSILPLSTLFCYSIFDIVICEQAHIIYMHFCFPNHFDTFYCLPLCVCVSSKSLIIKNIGRGRWDGGNLLWCLIILSSHNFPCSY